jgi:hypothetical protein
MSAVLKVHTTLRRWQGGRFDELCSTTSVSNDLEQSTVNDDSPSQAPPLPAAEGMDGKPP